MALSVFLENITQSLAMNVESRATRGANGINLTWKERWDRLVSCWDWGSSDWVARGEGLMVPQARKSMLLAV